MYLDIKMCLNTFILATSKMCLDIFILVMSFMKAEGVLFYIICLQNIKYILEIILR
jgi:hypothetical protein